MKIVILDGHAVNPGDLSWDFLNQYGEVTVYERTPLAEVAQRIGADCILIAAGHHSEERLLTCGVPVVKDLDACKRLLGV